jgi:hypothetical protein
MIHENVGMPGPVMIGVGVMRGGATAVVVVDAPQTSLFLLEYSRRPTVLLHPLWFWFTESRAERNGTMLSKRLAGMGQN